MMSWPLISESRSPASSTCAEKSLYPGLGACCHPNLELKFGIFAPHEEPPDVLCSARCSAPFVAGLSLSHLDYLFYQAVT